MAFYQFCGFFISPRNSGGGYSNSGRPSHFLVYAITLVNMVIFEARVLRENLSFWLKNHQF